MKNAHVRGPVDCVCLATQPTLSLLPTPTYLHTCHTTGLHLDPNNQQMKAALSDALSAKNRPPAGGGLFGPDALMRLAMDSRTRHLMDDKVGG